MEQSLVTQAVQLTTHHASDDRVGSTFMRFRHYVESGRNGFVILNRV